MRKESIDDAAKKSGGGGKNTENEWLRLLCSKNNEKRLVVRWDFWLTAQTTAKNRIGLANAYFTG